MVCGRHLYQGNLLKAANYFIGLTENSVAFDIARQCIDGNSIDPSNTDIQNLCRIKPDV